MHSTDADMGGLFDDIGDAFSDAADGIADVATSIADRVSDVATSIADRVAEASSIIKIVLQVIGTAASFVPGIGTAVSAVIAAGTALASGASITDAFMAGVKGALPGGPLVGAAFDLGYQALRGVPLDQAIIAALPIPDQAKVLVSGAIDIAKGIAAGKSLDSVLIGTVMSNLPPEVQGAVNVGMAIASGDIVDAAVNAAINNLPPGLRGPAQAIADGESVASVVGAQAVAMLPAEYQAGISLGMAMGQGQKLQYMRGLTLVGAVKNPVWTQQTIDKLQLGIKARLHNVTLTQSKGLTALYNTPSTLAKIQSTGGVNLNPALKGVSNITALPGVVRPLVASLVIKGTPVAPKPNTTPPAPSTNDFFARAGYDLGRLDNVVGAGRALLPVSKARRGFDIAIGMMNGTGIDYDAAPARKTLSADEWPGFDLATMFHAGNVTSNAPKSLTAPQQFGFYVTQGMQGADTSLKVSTMTFLTKDAAAKSGAQVAVDQIENDKRSWFGKLLHMLGLV